MAEAQVPKRTWFFKLCYPFIWIFVGILLTILGPVRIRGRKNIPKRGPVLILSNHLADIDPVIVHWASFRYVNFMAKREIFQMRFIGAFVHWFCAFPVERGTPDRKAIRTAISLLNAGNFVGVFPEGQLSEDGNLQPILPGAALVAKMANVPVICCGLSRTNRIMPYGAVVPRPAFGWVTIQWGKLHEFEKGTEVDEIASWIESQFAELIASGS